MKSLHRKRKKSVPWFTGATAFAFIVGISAACTIAALTNSWPVTVLHMAGVLPWIPWAYANGYRAGEIVAGAQAIVGGGSGRQRS